MSKNRNYRLDLLKALACILITNCHVNYPISYLKLGGAHGNSLFFIVSGFLLVSVSTPFLEWVLRRWKRLAIPMGGIIVAFVFTRIGVERILSLGIVEFLVRLVNAYWFVFAIAIYYPFYYWVVRRKKIGDAIKALLIWIIVYIILYIFVVDKTSFVVEGPAFAWFKVFFYFAIFVAGALIRFIYDTQKVKKQPYLLLVVLTISVAVWVVEYALMTVFNKGYAIQFVIHVCIFVFAAVALCLVLWNMEQFPQIDKIFMHTPWLSKAVSKIAGATLEIYLVQTTFKLMINRLSFPISMVVLWIVAIGGGIVYHSILERITRQVRKV